MLYASIRQMSQTLTNLNGFLEAAEKFANDKDFPVENLLAARLAPDMFNLVRQVQSAADAAKFAAARLAGKDAPSDPDNESTIDELKARVAKTIEYLSTFENKDFDGGAEREITLSFLPAPMLGHNYFVQLAQPNFLFHVSMTYAILRHNGVSLGKQAFIGHVDLIEQSA